MAGHAERMWENRNSYRILVGKPEGKRPLGRTTCRWVDNIKMDVREIGWGGIVRTDLAQDRGTLGAILETVMNIWDP
jgi:hypothetical protein